MVLDSGRDPLVDSGYGYEHMGDMARDLEPLAREDVPWLLSQVRTLREELRIREQSQIPVVPEAVAGRVRDLEAALREARPWIEELTYGGNGEEAAALLEQIDAALASPVERTKDAQ